MARRGRRLVLDELSFVANPGVLAVLGPNGAGKSTLLRVLVGLGQADAGIVRFAGHDLRSGNGLKAARAMTGFQPQKPQFPPRFTVAESVGYAAWLKGIPRQGSLKAVTRALESTHLTDLAGRALQRLSGGEQKRAAIAQAIVHSPELLLLDEPSAALDPAERRAVLQVISVIGQTTTVIMSTHITSDLASANDVLIVDQGRARFHGSAGDFRRRSTRGAVDQWESAYASVTGTS